MSAGPDDSDYDEDAARIDGEYIPDDATTEEEIEDALDAAGFPAKSQSDISDWLVDEGDAWDLVGEVVDVDDPADGIEQALDRESRGTADSDRARQIAESVGDEIDAARREASQNLTVASDGTVRRPDGAPVGEFNNLEETVRDDGIYYRNVNSGQEFKAAGFRGGQ